MRKAFSLPAHSLKTYKNLEVAGYDCSYYIAMLISVTDIYCEGGGHLALSPHSSSTFHALGGRPK